MDDYDDSDILLLDEESGPIIIEDECKAFKPVLREFVENYTDSRDKPVEAWLEQKLQEKLPDKKPEEIQSMTQEIITTLETDEAKSNSLSKAISSGRSKESWFASEAKKATSAMSTQEAAKYLADLDTALQNANEALYRTITTQAGAVSQNPRLAGFIAEQYHAQTFNMNAAAKGSPYRAKVVEPTGTYNKNSVDIVIVDGNGKVVRRYQSKYCKDANATAQAFKKGDYRGQRKLVPKGQEGKIQKKTETVIKAPDGTTSNPLPKTKADQMQKEAQSGNWNELINWNEYATKDLAIGIGKQAGYAALQGAAVGVGFDVAQKLWSGGKIDANEVVETAIVSGVDFGVKAAVSGALKVAAEKEIITVIPKGTPAGTVANIAYVAIEDAKVLGKMASGELSMKEGIDKIEQTTVATTAGLMSSGKGAAIGAEIGAVFGPVGSAIGGFVGGTIGYMAGSKIGEGIVKCAQKIRDGAVKVVKTIATGVNKADSAVFNATKSVVKGLCSGIKSLFSWW